MCLAAFGLQPDTAHPATAKRSFVCLLAVPMAGQDRCLFVASVARIETTSTDLAVVCGSVTDSCLHGACPVASLRSPRSTEVLSR